MSTGSHIKKKPMRTSAMESLGFIETSGVSWVSAVAVTRPPTAPSRLVSTATKAHLTVEEMWDTTELHADSMVDWKPDEVDNRRLNKRVRWPMTVFLLLLFGAVGYAAYWVWQAPANGAEAALAVVNEDAASLESTLEPLQTASDSLVPGQSIDATAITAAASAVDSAGRQLFTSSGDLPASELSNRSAATDAATQALDAAKALTGATAYIAAVTPVMSAPTLTVDPQLIDLATAATEFGAWRSRFDMVRAALPEGAMSRVTQELALLSGSLDPIQTAYLDALRLDDAVAAQTAVQSLQTMLTTAWDVLVTETELVSDSISSRIASTRGSLDLLTG